MEQSVPDAGTVEEDTATPAAMTGDADREALTLEACLSWLAAIRPAAVLTLLRDPEFAFISMTAFAGFRVNAAGYANPLVRRRLAQEVLQNDNFAEKIRALAEATPSAIVRGQAHAVPREARTVGTSQSREDELRAERDRRRRERDEARNALQGAQDARTESEAARRKAEEDRDTQAQRVQQQAARIARLERQTAKMQTERTALLKALRQDKVSTPPRATPSASREPAPSELRPEGTDLWREAVRHLLHKGKLETVLALAQDVLRAAPEDRTALDLAAQVYERMGETREAAEMASRLLAARLERGEMAAAAEALVRRLLLTHPAEASREARQWLSHLRSSRGEGVMAGRLALERLRVLSPSSYAWMASEIAAVAPALADELMPPPGALGPDDPLPLPIPWTPRRLWDAVNTNEEQTVSAAREALAVLHRADPPTYARAWSAIAKTEDDSVFAPLRRTPRGAAVVDGSNVAWFDQESLAQPRARLAPLLALRRALRRRGYFPVLLYADAPLPYTVDDPHILRAMLGRGEITLVDSGVDADEVLLREAKRWGGPLVTNDYMTDWDPENEVEKVQYTISSLTGEAHLLT